MQKFHTIWIWFQVSFEDLSQGKIKTLQKTNFTKEQFKEIAKKLKTITRNEFTNKFYVLNKQITKTQFFSSAAFLPPIPPWNKFPPRN